MRTQTSELSTDSTILVGFGSTLVAEASVFVTKPAPEHGSLRHVRRLFAPPRRRPRMILGDGYSMFDSGGYGLQRPIRKLSTRLDHADSGVEEEASSPRPLI